MPISSVGTANAQTVIDAAVAAAIDEANTLIAAHEAKSTDVHGAVSGTSKVALLHGGGRRIFVQATAPTAESANDVWLDT